jgi:hypothetical protein
VTESVRRGAQLALANQYGVTPKVIKKLGLERFRAMPEDARLLMISLSKAGPTHFKRKGVISGLELGK